MACRRMNGGSLGVDTSTMVLDGVHLHQASPAWWIVRGVPPGAESTRMARGGIGTISYSSSNTGVATVDQNGTVISQSNGTATITASDRSGSRVSYTVQSSNNYTLYESGPGTDMTFPQALAWIAGSNLNHPIPHHHDTPLGRRFSTAFGVFATIGSVFIHHYGTLNPGSQTLTNRQHIHRRIRLPRGLRPTSQATDALQGGLKCREEVGRLASPG